MNQHLGRVGTATFLLLALLGGSGLWSAATPGVASLLLPSARAAGPAHAESAHAEPAHAEPAHAEPAHAEPAR
ncbi:MAG TPA: hypothetical protein PLW65_34770, partial [Pseudomonadota bacterium]|nr:hypothetical protein [Pseudomonadota bacterium]